MITLNGKFITSKDWSLDGKIALWGFLYKRDWYAVSDPFTRNGFYFLYGQLDLNNILHKRFIEIDLVSFEQRELSEDWK